MSISRTDPFATRSLTRSPFLGGFGRNRHGRKSGGVLSGASPHIAKFSEGIRFGGDGRAGLSVPSVLAVDPFAGKPARRLNHVANQFGRGNWRMADACTI
jgi:hypothetical protein